MGHNFGAEHDPDGLAECAPNEDQGGKFVMYPIAVSGDHENNKVCAGASLCGSERKRLIIMEAQKSSVLGMELSVTKHLETWGFGVKHDPSKSG